MKFLILGAGMSGILAGIRLKEAGLNDFEILERADEVGGTWRDNTYPGLHCDVPAHSYDYSFEPCPTWNGFYATGPELGRYFRECARKYDLIPYVRFHTSVTNIYRENGLWVVESADGKRRTADVVINCLGILSQPKMADIAGIDSFKGALFHSAQWDHEVPLDGKRIGVVGTGSTAAQITSALAPRAGHYSLFQRSAQWVMPAHNMYRNQLLRAAHRLIPGFSQLTGGLQQQLFMLIAKGLSGDNEWVWKVLDKACRSYLASVRDPDLREKLTPNFKVGCRRLIFCDGFYESLQLPTSELVTSGIQEIEADGVRTVDGRLHELDVLVMATGFHALNFTYNFDVRNDSGQSLSEQWADGAQALHGVAMENFPNYFMLIGPYSPVGNFSLTAIAEIQMDYLMGLINVLQKGEAKQISVKPEAQERYMDYLRAGMGKTVWTSGCPSWYLGKDGLPQLYPYAPKEFAKQLKHLDLAEFMLA